MGKYDSVARLRRYFRTLTRVSSAYYFDIKKDNFTVVFMSVFEMGYKISLLTMKNLTITF